MIRCGSQCLTCDYPIHMDTYKGCGHGCVYCYVKHKYSIADVQPIDTRKSLRNFVNGGRNFETKWCDWDIPIHWGANSDPFQPAESIHRKSLECLKIFAETGYPVIISTKNPGMLLDPEYSMLLERCRAVLQVSMACDRYDKLEPGAPTFQSRLEAVRGLRDISTKLGVAVAIEKEFKQSLVNIMQKFDRDAEIEDLLRIICLGASSDERQSIRQNALEHWDFTDLRNAANELLIRLSFSGTSEEVERKLDKREIGEKEKNAIREMLGLPLKPVLTQSNSSEQPIGLG